jgi:tripartite-type tricarboxylate transporter receptor subunit TctC
VHYTCRWRIAALAVAALAGAAAHAASQESYPLRPVRMIVPFSPSGGSDAIARLVAPKMSEVLGQPVVVDNRPGGNTVIGVRLVGTARPDGHTLLLANANFTINAALYEKLPYDPVKDFVAVAPLANVANVLVVHPAIPAQTVKELVALVRAKPGQLNFASPGAGTSSHMSGVLLQSLARLDFVTVPYKGAGPAIIDLIGGQVSMAVAAMSSIVPHLKSGRVRALGVTTAKRSVLMPDLPTIAESGIPGYDVTNWFGVLAAAGTPLPVLVRLEDVIAGIGRDADFQKAMGAQGTEPFVLSHTDFERFIRAEVVKWAKLGRDYKLRVE